MAGTKKIARRNSSKLWFWLVLAGLAAPVQAQEASGLDFLEGQWRIEDPSGHPVGTSDIVSQFPGAMLFEQRSIGDREPQALWFENAERNGGWTQLFVDPTGMTREFIPRSESGQWPVAMGANTTLQNGQDVEFRMTLNRDSADRSRRILEISRDGGESWSTIFDYQYVRIAE
jgi:hypothetical protein